MIERRPITDRATWLEWRKRDVTASAVGALFGCHPYVTALRLYAEKRGAEFAPLAEDNKILRRGRWLEPAVAAAVGEMRPEWRLTPAREYLSDPVLRLGATPDYCIYDFDKGRGILQIKTAAPSVYERDWQGGKEPPLWVLLQASCEMFMADADFAAVAVMLVDPHAMEVEICDLPRNPAVEEKIASAVADFWSMVAEAREPDADYGRDRDVIRAMYPKPAPGKVVDLRGSNEIPAMLASRASMKADNAANDKRIEIIEAEILHKIGDAESALVDGWRITNKMVSTSGYTVKPREARQLRILDRRQQ